MLENRSTDELTARLEQAERDGNWDRAERIEAELERRDCDDSDPASRQNTREDARDYAEEAYNAQLGREG